MERFVVVASGLVVNSNQSLEILDNHLYWNTHSSNVDLNLQ
jgi:hypothetical protein